MHVFTAIAVLLAIAAILSFINDRYLRLQHHIGVLLLALLTTGAILVLEEVGVSGVVAQVRRLTGFFTLSETLLKGALCFMLFYGSLHVRWSALREQRWLVLALAVVGTPVAGVVAGSLVYGAMSSVGVVFSLVQALLFGALIAATDPVAALAILSKAGLPENLKAVLDGESLFNDGVAVVLFSVFAAAAVGPVAPTLAEAGATLLREALGGALLGLAGWSVIHFFLVRTDTYGTYLLVSLGMVACLYAAAQYIHVSGPIATVVAGLACGTRTLPKLDDELVAKGQTFWAGLDDVLNSLLFVFVGFHVVLIDPLPGVVPGVPAVAAIVAVLVARAMTVSIIVGGLGAAGLLRSKKRWDLTKLLTWGGLRGGLSLAMAVSLPESPWQYLILNMTFAVVVFSIVVQGLTIKRMFRSEELAGLLSS